MLLGEHYRNKSQLDGWKFDNDDSLKQLIVLEWQVPPHRFTEHSIGESKPSFGVFRELE